MSNDTAKRSALGTNQYTNKPRRASVQITNDIAGIVLTRGEIALVDARYADYLGQWNWNARARKSNPSIYAVRGQQINGKEQAVLLHRVIMSLGLERELLPFPLEEVDHIDGDGKNNLATNLRLATHQQNTQNQRLRTTNTSGFKGVYFNKSVGKWQSYIRKDGKVKHLGVFDTPEIAYAAYCEAAKELYGDFARFE